MTLFLESGAAAGGSNLSFIIMMVALIAVFYFFMIRPENKRKKKAQEMRDSLKKGDTITTIGGIVGKIVAINDVNAVDKEFVLETGLDGSKSTMVFDFNAIYQVMSKSGNPAEAKKEEVKPVEVAAEEKVEEKSADETESK